MATTIASIRLAPPSVKIRKLSIQTAPDPIRLSVLTVGPPGPKGEKGEVSENVDGGEF